MADDKLKLDLDVEVSVHNLEQAKALRQEFELLEQEITKLARDLRATANPFNSLARARGQLNAETAKGGRESLDIDRQLYGELRKRLSFERRMISQRKSEESDAAKQVRDEQAETARQFRQQMAFNTRVARQRAQAEADAERETRREILATARMRDREARKALADAKAVQRTQQQAAAGAARGAGQVRSGVGRTVTTGGAAAAVVGYGAKRALDVLTRSGVGIDAAINKNTRLSGLNPRDAEKAGADIRKRAMPIARSLGIKTAEYLAARAEAIQAGVEDELVDTVTEFGSKYARLNDMPAAEVMESSGYGITALGAFGKVTADRVKQLFNIQQHLAATTAASRQGLNAFVRRGLSAGAAAGFSVEDTLAYGGAATSSGADGEMAARMLSSTTERLASLPTKAAGLARRKHKTPHDRIFLSLPRKLGFKSWAEVKAAFSKDSAGTMEKLYEGLATVGDPRERLELSEDIWGREFGSVHAAMAVGHRFRDMRRSVRSRDAGRAIDAGMSVRAGSFDMIVDQIGSAVQDLKDGLGLVLKPFWADLRDYALQAPAAFRQFEDAFRGGLEGLVVGLGGPGSTFAGLIRRVLGDPAEFQLNARKFGEFGRGFGTGLREAATSIRSVITAFTGRDMDAENIGRLAGKFLLLSTASLALAPVIGVIGGLSSVVLGVVGLARAAAGVLGAGAATGGLGGGAVAGALAGVARLLSGGFILGLAGAIGSMRGEIATLVLDAVRPMVSALWEGLKKAFTLDGLKAGGKAIVNELVPAPLQRWLDGGAPAAGGNGSTPEGHATGGYITGPGGPRSDSILARLSNGEFVVNAAAASEHRGLLEAINGGAPGYALGGVVGQSPGSSAFSAMRAEESTRSLTAAIQDLVRTLRKDQSDRQLDRYGRRRHRTSGGWTAGSDEAYGRVSSGNPGQMVNHGIRGHVARLRGTIGGGGVPGAGGRAVSGPGNGTMPTSSTAGSLTELINQEAARAGIDPRILHGIRAGESGHRSDYDVKSDSREDSYGPFQLNRRGGLGATFERETGFDARDPKTIPAQTRWVAELIKKRGRGVLRQWYGYKGDRDADPSWGNSGYMPNTPAGSGGSVAGSPGGPVARGQGGQSVPHLDGQIDVEGARFDFGSGGHRGSNSIPFGTYPITPNAIGPWGRANGAIGINGNQIWDKTLGRMRDGIEFHAASNARKLTAGCIGIAREQYATFKDRLLSVYRRTGKAFLTVGPNGASITAERPTDPGAKVADDQKSPQDRPAGVAERVAADTKRTRDLGGVVMKPKLGDLDLTPQGGVGTKAPLGQDAPLRSAPAGGSANGQAGSGNQVHAPITVVSHGGDAQEIASKVQRHLQDAMNRRTHDYDGFA